MRVLCLSESYTASSVLDLAAIVSNYVTAISFKLYGAHGTWIPVKCSEYIYIYIYIHIIPKAGYTYIVVNHLKLPESAT